MSSENESAISYHYREHASDLQFSSLPKTVEQAFESAHAYYEQWLKPAMPGLLATIENIESDCGKKDSDTACVFLDRDSRPAMYTWNIFSKPRDYLSFPVAVSTPQFEPFLRHYEDFENAYLGDIHDPDEWSNQIDKIWDRSIYAYPDVTKWIEAFRERHSTKLADRELVAMIDIGYRGSAAELSRYLFHKAFPDKTVKSILLYKYSNRIPIRSVFSDETTWYAENTIPHATTGYVLEPSSQTYHYIREGNTPVENAFYRGIIDAAELDEQK